MKIHLAKSAGFCSGVKRAIEIAFKTAKENKEAYMLGDIVHNEEVISQIAKAGIKKISKLMLGKKHILLIRAHGAGLKTYTAAKKLGYTIVDATCPMVKEIHKIVKEAEGKGFKIIIVGDKKHDEVQGIIGQLKTKAIIIEKPEEIPYLQLKHVKKAIIVSQSTQNIEKVEKILRLIKPLIKEVEFYNTICRPTRVKQEEIKTLTLQNDLVIIIGSKTSANTRRLYEISRSLNKRSYWVASKKGLHAEWFKGVASV